MSLNHLTDNQREIVINRTRVWYKQGYSPAYIARTFQSTGKLHVTEQDVRSILGVPDVDPTPIFQEPTARRAS